MNNIKIIENKLLNILYFYQIVKIFGEKTDTVITEHSPDYLLEIFKRFICNLEDFDLMEIDYDSDNEFINLLNDYKEKWFRYEYDGEFSGKFINILYYVYNINKPSTTLLNIIDYYKSIIHTDLTNVNSVLQKAHVVLASSFEELKESVVFRNILKKENRIININNIINI